jgi:hypothetical protein
MTKTLLFAALVCALLAASAQAQETAPVTVQCGPGVFLTIKLDLQGKPQIIATRGLPDGVFRLEFKDNELYVGGHMCKPVCDTSAERRC